MDSSGRLHMPGFVGGTFEETGLIKPRSEKKELLHPSEDTPSTGNRRDRRRDAALARRKSKPLPTP